MYSKKHFIRQKERVMRMKRFAVTIARTCGSGGTPIAKLLCEEYGISLYDKKLLALAAEKSGINEALFLQADESVD